MLTFITGSFALILSPLWPPNRHTAEMPSRVSSKSVVCRTHVWRLRVYDIFAILLPLISLPRSPSLVAGYGSKIYTQEIWQCWTFARGKNYNLRIPFIVRALLVSRATWSSSQTSISFIYVNGYISLSFLFSNLFPSSFLSLISFLVAAYICTKYPAAHKYFMSMAMVVSWATWQISFRIRHLRITHDFSCSKAYVKIGILITISWKSFLGTPKLRLHGRKISNVFEFRA